MSNSLTLAERIQHLEDIEAIRKLTATYALYVNKGWNGKEANLDKLGAVFAEDARWSNATTTAIGPDGIARMLEPAMAILDFAMHSFSNPIIDVDGDHATGNWLLWVAVKSGTSANEVFQSEDLTYVRTNSGWRIKNLSLHFGTMLLG